MARLDSLMRLSLLAAALALFSGGSRAQAQDYPARPVTIVVPFAAGGGTDILGRLVADRLERRFGRPFVVEDRPGAGSTTGAAFVARANPDGYTLLMAPSPTMAVAISIYRNLPYDPLADFVPLALVALAKQKPGELSFGSAGPGTPHHLYAELFKSMTGIEMSHIPYRGSLPLLNDLVAGHIPLAFVDFGPAVGMLQTGAIRPLGISARARLAQFPDIPPFAEAGVPGFDVASWQMIVAPAKTPPLVIDRLHEEILRVVAQPEFKQQIVNGGMLPMDNPSIEGLEGFVRSEIARWGAVVKQAGLQGSE